MKELFEQVIALKNYDLKALLANIDQSKKNSDKRRVKRIGSRAFYVVIWEQ